MLRLAIAVFLASLMGHSVLAAERVLDQGTVSGKDCSTACASGADAVRDTVCIQAALDASATSGEEVELPAAPSSYCWIEDTLTITSVRGMTVYGHGITRTKLIWDPKAGAGTVMWQLDDVGESVFRGFSLHVNSGDTLDKAFSLDNISAASVVPTGNRFVDIYIDSGPAGELNTGFSIDTTGSTANNERHQWEHVQVYGYDEEGWYVGTSQAMGLHWTGCACNGETTTDTACIRGYGSWLVDGMVGGRNEVDYHIYGAQAPMHLNGGVFENSLHFLETNTSSSVGPIMVSNTRWDANGMSDSATGADRYVMNVGIVGPVVVTNSMLGRITKPAEFYFHAPNEQSVVFLGVDIQSSLADPYPGVDPVFSAGVTLNDDNTPNVWDDTPSTLIGGDATPSVRLAGGSPRMWLTAGTTTITDFDDGWEGQELFIVAATTITITDNANIKLKGSTNYAMTADDTLTVRHHSGVWYEVSRSER